MRAVVYNGPHDVTVTDVPDARIEEPTDVLVRITTTNICGSDLHMYEGRTSVETGTVFGHENMGIVEEVGSAVTRIRVGDRVSVPVQHRLRHLPQLHARVDVVLPAHQPDRGRRRRRLRLREHGPVPGRAGRVAARAVR